MGIDNVVRFGRLSYVRARVEVRKILDRELAVYYQGQRLVTRSAHPETPVMRQASRDMT